MKIQLFYIVHKNYISKNLHFYGIYHYKKFQNFLLTSVALFLCQYSVWLSCCCCWWQ